MAHVNARVRGTERRRILDQDIFALDRINAVGAIRGFGTAGPLNSYIAYGDVFAVIDFQAVALAVFDGNVFDGEIARIHQHAFGTRNFILEGQDAFIRARAAYRYAVRTQGENTIQRMPAGGDFDDGTRFRIQELLLQLLLECLLVG